MSWRRLALVVAVGCGDGSPANLPLIAAPNLAIVAHAGDELVAMQPDTADALAAGDRLAVIYLADDGLRHAALEAAYAPGASWSCGATTLAGEPIASCRSDAVSLVFLGTPPGELLRSWQGDRDTLVAIVGDAITQVAPTTLRTLEIAATHGDDEVDHEVAGAIAVVALGTIPAGPLPAVISYRGRNVLAEPPNSDPAAGTTMLARFEQPIPADHAGALQRHYPVDSRVLGSGKLELGGLCARIDASVLTLGDCTDATTWQLASDGRLLAGAQCLQIQITGELVAIDELACAAGPMTRFLLDAEGHLWSTALPPAANITTHQHLECLAPSAGRFRGVVCGDTLAPSWTLVP